MVTLRRRATPAAPTKARAVKAKHTTSTKTKQAKPAKKTAAATTLPNVPASASILSSFLDTIQDESKKQDIQELYSLIRKHAPDQTPEVQGKNTLAFGGFQYKTKSNCQGRWARIGIMTNKTGMSLFVSGVSANGKYLLESYDKKDFGKAASVGKSCIRFKKLSDLNLNTVKRIIEEMNTANVENAV